jgi:DNA modification methylase
MGVWSLLEHSRGPRPLDDLKVIVRSLSHLKPNPRNARMHSRRQIRQIADSIQAFGFNNPVLVDEDGLLIAGHGRVEAAKLLGMGEVPTVCLALMSEEQKRPYVIADNRLAEKAGWDKEILAVEFETLFEMAPELDLTVTGFELAEIDLIIGDKAVAGEPDVLDEFSPPQAKALVVTRPGDLWQLGDHRVLCADATQEDSYICLLQGHQAQMVFADPPYNVPIRGHVSGLGHAQHAEFPMASGEMSDAAYTAFLTTSLEKIETHSSSGAIAFVCMDWRHLYELLAAGRATKLTLKNVCVWVKTNAGMGTFYRSQHELIAVFKVGDGPHINSFELGQYGRRRTNVWTYPGFNSFGAGRDATLAMHPTVKPVALIADAIKDCSKRNGLILDPFLGSGTTILAAEVTGRRAAGLELDPRYVDCAVRRWQRATGKFALLGATDESFEAIAAARAGEVKEAAHG